MINLRNGYNSRLNFASNDAFKVPFGKSVINYFKNTGQSKIYCKVITDYEVGVSPQQAALEKIKHYKSLMETIGVPMANMKISTKSQSPFGPSAYYNAQFPAQASGAQMNAIPSYNNNLLQMAGFLAGTILMDLRGVGKPDSVKWKLNAYLKFQFGVTTFNIGDNIQDKIYII